MTEEINTAAAPEEELSQEELNSLKKIRMDKLDAMKAAGKNPFEITKFDFNITAADLKAHYEAEEAKVKQEAGEDEAKLNEGLEAIKQDSWRIAGRILSWRDMGKANFINIQDVSGRIQCYVRINDIGEDNFAEFKKWDIGDIVGVEGFVFRTRRGEVSLHAKRITLLSKSLLPLPEKWHGLKDRDARYRQRYLDLIVNPEV